MRKNTDFATATAVITSLATAFTFALLAVLYFQHKIDINFWFNADSLSLPGMVKDLVFGEGKIAEWFMNPAPDFITDWPLYAIAELVSPHIHTTWIIFSVLQYLTLLLVLYFFFRTYFDRRHSIACAGVGTSWLILLASQLVQPYFLSVIGGFHFNEFILFIVWCHLLNKCFAKKQFGWASLYPNAIMAASALATVSDRLFAVHVTAPCIAIAFFDWYRNRQSAVRNRDFEQITKFTAAGTLFGVILSKSIIVNSTTYGFKLDPRGFVSSVTAFILSLTDLATSFPAGPFALFAILLFFFLTGREAVREKNHSALLSRFISASALVTLAVLTLGNIHYTSRYMMQVFMVPIVLWPLLLRSNQQRRRMQLMTVVASLLPVAFMINAALAGDQSFKTEFIPPEVKCVREIAQSNALNAGIAQYWLVKPVRLLTEGTVELAPYRMERGHFEYFNWSGKTTWEKPAYDFAAISTEYEAGTYERLDEAALVALNGAPAKIETCGTLRILVYGKGQLRMPPPPPKL